MKKISIITLLFMSINMIYSQDYDLIVTTNGDSVACHIDSITDTQIYLEMRYNNNWIHTYMNKNKIIEYKYNAIDKKKFYFEPGNSKIHPGKYLAENHHAHIYSFGPSSLSLNKGDRYYTMYYGLMHDFQFGISDQFALRAGSFLFMPFYLLPTYTFSINDKSSFAIGDLFIFMIGEFYGNLTYVMYTHGSKENNISIGAGFWTPNIIEIGEVGNSAAFNLSGQYRISDRVYFTTENYGFQLYSNHTAYIGDEDNDYGGGYHTMDDVFFGLSGIKVKGRKNGLNCWQFSLLYVFNREGEAPDKYHNPPWQGVEEGKITFVPVPIIGYSRKFGKKY